MNVRASASVLVVVLSTAAAARALYGGAEAPADEGGSAVRFDWRGRGASGSCSGSLVGARSVLTAAHCVRSTAFGEHRIATVRVGNPAGSTSTARVVAIHVHPDFDATRPEHGSDVAVLSLAEVVSGRVPHRLASAADDPTDQGVRLLIEGFGLTTRNRRVVRTRALRTVSLEYLSPFQCFDGDVAGMARNRMCAASPSDGVCPGDSGSAATITRGGERIVVGVVSLAIDQRTCSDTAAVLTRVSAMRGFLDPLVQ